MADHILKPSRKNLHGSLSKSIPPVLTITPGETVDFTTLEADWRIARPDSPLSSSGVFMERSFSADQGHALCGPVFICLFIRREPFSPLATDMPDRGTVSPDALQSSARWSR